ncbi:MAG: hypothetical protein JXN61_15720 [Sedimentisphaerales bacterium]|nr:hypothetical protein [Sedimentisphaerales bacterium]
MMCNRNAAVLLACLIVVPGQTRGAAPESAKRLVTGEFKWVASEPVLAPMKLGDVQWIAVKDPSVVRYKDRWHVFCTVRGIERSHAVVYVTFKDWSEAKQAKQQILQCHPGFFCAPQVFYFTPHKNWYLLFQASDESWEPKYGPACSTTADIAKPDSWTELTPLFDKKPSNIEGWLDFWIICDEAKAHLFFTSLNGKMWRCETSLEDFPHGWSQPVVALQADVFEASHTYRLKGQDKYLTLIEAQNGHGWRYYKAYLADRLDGQWTPLAGEKDKAFASMLNVEHPGHRWTDVISHGELLRAGCDERLEVDPENLRFLFQGVLDKDRAGKNYGQIPWRLGILRPVR